MCFSKSKDYLKNISVNQAAILLTGDENKALELIELIKQVKEIGFTEYPEQIFIERNKI